MSDDNNVYQRSQKPIEQIVSDFLCNTCRVNPKPNIHRFHALYYCNNVASLRFDTGDYSVIATSSGSASEFYIEPMLSCINDYDVMYHRNDWLAVPAGHQVPRCLPPEFHHRVTVFELIETEFPCYVLVKRVGELIKCNSEENFSFSPSEDDFYATITHLEDVTREHGPAGLHLNSIPALRNYIINDRDSSWMSVDIVFCIRCLIWPPQAAEWETRHRKYDWPDMKTVDLIVNNGCDVVQIAHPQCRQYEYVRKLQWRLSFSRAETVLLNTWSVKQQVVYHVLRLFMKTIRSKYNLNDFIHNYLIKTTILWACEELSLMIWIQCSLVCMSQRLVHKLATCMSIFDCPSFFVKGCNLLRNSENTNELKSFASYLTNVTGELLCVWLIENYIRQYAMHCPYGISELFPIDENFQLLPHALSRITDWRRRSLGEISYSDFSEACVGLQRLTFNFPSSTQISWSLCKYIIEQMNAVDSRLLVYYHALILLKIASLLDRGHSALTLVNVILMFIQSGAFIFSNDESALVKCMNIRNTKPVHVHVSSRNLRSLTVCKHFQTASFLMHVSRLSHNKVTFVSSLLNELSKFFLQLAMDCTSAKCSDFHAVSCGISNVYMACLYLSTKQYKLTFNQLSKALSSSSQTHCGPFGLVQRQFLPCFDKTVETLLGLMLFYQLLRQKFPNHRKQHRRRVDVFTVDLLALYLMNLCSDVYCLQFFCTSRTEVYSRYKTCLVKKRKVTVADILLFYATHQKTIVNGLCKLQFFSISHECIITISGLQSCNFKTTRLSRLLVQYAVDRLTEFRISMSRDFSSVRQIMTTDYQAMCAYKCRVYEQCNRLCKSNFVYLLYEPADVLSVTESFLIHLLDDECSSLIGLAKLCGVFDINPWARECVNQLTLSMYLLIQSALRLRQLPTTFIDSFRRVMIVYHRHSHGSIINRALMIFAYRKAMKQLRSEIDHRVVLGKTF
jgi:Mab-21 protein